MIKKKTGIAAALAGLMLVLTPVTAYAGTESAATMEELARIVTQHAMERDEDFDVEYTGSEADMEAFLNDEDLTFFYSTIALADDPDTAEDADYVTGNLDFGRDPGREYDYQWDGQSVYFKLFYHETLQQTEYVRQHVPQILAKLGVDQMSNYEKVKTIHDYICDLITYVDDFQNCSSMYSALATKKGLCNSYALCTYRLLVEAGIPCKYICGKAGTGRDAEGHAWNIVALGDKWYNLDATWDDQDEIIYDYFLKGSSDFDEADPSEKHVMETAYSKGAFAKEFPIAATAFQEGMNDENVNIKIGSDVPAPGPEIEPEPGEKYSASDIVGETDPEDGYFQVKRKKNAYLTLYINEGMEKLIKNASCEAVTGGNRIKNLDISDVTESEDYPGEYYIDLSFKGKKKGKVSIVVTLELTNGQKLVYQFDGKVKK